MISQGDPVVFDGNGNAAPVNRVKRKLRGEAKALFGGFKGANDENLMDWVFTPLNVNQILRNDLQKLRTRSRDLVCNDETARRYLALLEQNVLGHRGIRLQAKNKLRNGKLDKRWNDAIETGWRAWGSRRGGAPSACGAMSWREFELLTLRTWATDGEAFIQKLRGYPHNEQRFAVRLLSADLLDHAYTTKNQDTGNRIEMGIELDEFDRPVAYHFSEGVSSKDRKKRRRIPAEEIIHLFKREFPGQLRGFPIFAGIMHKAKMLNGVNEAIVVGWRVAAAKMGFFVSKDEEDFDVNNGGEGDSGIERRGPESAFDATPGSFDYIDDATDFKAFDVRYPDSTFREGHKVFMHQMANGLNVSSPTLSNDYSDVNYSSLRQALLEDRSGWRLWQYGLFDGLSLPLFDDWYEWATRVTGTIAVAATKRFSQPVIVPDPSGWAWIDPLKEVRAQVEANAANLRTRQSILSDNGSGDFVDVADELQAEAEALMERGLMSEEQPPAEDETEDDDE